MKSRKFQWMILFLFFISLVAVPSLGFSHCEIPCGIYDDQARINQLAEDIATVEKSMLKIQELSADPKTNMNQLVRWVDNKDTHANRIKETIATYFLSQRIKMPKEGDDEAQNLYELQLTLLHHMTVTAMKAKQTTSLDYINKLRDQLEEFRVAYFGLAGLMLLYTIIKPCPFCKNK